MINFPDPRGAPLTRDDPSAFAAPAQFGPFRVLHQIGVGALGPVFRTYEPDRDRLVAVKVFRLDITPEQARALADELARAAEAGLFHPSIVEPIAAGVEGSVAYDAEEYVAAESLDIALRHYAPGEVDTILPFITQLAGAIDFARTVGVGHGALHPRDIFVTPEEARATGFGVVEALERVGLRAPVRRPYSAPERISGSAWSTPADVFSLAAITYELLTARRPAGLGTEIGPLGGAAAPLHAVLARAMDEQPAQRYPTALALASALEAAARGGLRPGATPGEDPTHARLPGAAAAAPLLAFEEPVDGERVPESRGLAPDDDQDDIAAELEEDVAHQRLMRQEREEIARRETDIEREAGIGLDEDSEIEAEADRYAGDDFLLDAAGAASAPEPSSPDDFRAADSPIDPRALDDDEVLPDETPSAVFAPEDIRREQPRVPRGVPPPSGSHAAGAPYGGGSSLGYAPTAAAPSDRRSRFPLALTLALGLAAGFAGGYALWGGGGSPAERVGSEQAPDLAGSASNASSTPPARDDTPAEGTNAPAAPAGSAPAGAPAPAAGSAGTGPPAPSEGASAPPASGTLIVRSAPSGAGVTVNGRWRGRTPLTLENLPFARYDVRVAQPGYSSSRETVTLSPDSPARSFSLRLQEQARRQAPSASARRPAAATGAASTNASARQYTGSIYVDSRPRGARVTIDGKPVGVTPLSISDVRIGSHVVRLELPDHRIWSSTARVTAGAVSRVTGSLERIQ